MSNGINLRNVRDAVSARREFKGSNMFARWEGNNLLYVVYSYGEHFPMYLYNPGEAKWYGNNDKYSPSTSRQQGACRPYAPIEWLDTEALLDVVNKVLYA